MPSFVTLSAALVFPLLLVLGPGSASAQTRDRASVAEQETWKLDDIYPSEEAWTQAKDRISGEFDKVLAFQGTLSSSPDKLLACLELDSRIGKELSRLGSYASMKSDQDTRQARYQGMKQVLRQTATQYGSQASFIGPEVVTFKPGMIEEFLRREPRLRDYRMMLDDMTRTRAHRLSTAEEKILAQAGLIAGAPASIFSVFSVDDYEEASFTVTHRWSERACLGWEGPWLEPE